MQKCMLKIQSFGNSSRAVVVFLRLSLDLVEKVINHCQVNRFKIVEKETELEENIKCLEKSKIEIHVLLKDDKHSNRKSFYDEMVANIAYNVANLLVNQPIDNDDLKVALCIYEIYCEKIDFGIYKIVQLKLCKGRESRESIAYENTCEEISVLQADGKTLRESLQFRSCLRTIQRLTNGHCPQAVNIRLMMLIQNNEEHIELVNEEIHELSLITDLSVNKDELVTAHEEFKSKTSVDNSQLEDILNDNDNVGRTMFNKQMFEVVTKLNDEEIELLDKVIYNKEIYDKNCPICFNEHTDGQLLVWLKCPCKRKRFCQDCTSKALKEKSQCPCCIAYV